MGWWSRGAAILAAELGHHRGQGWLSTCWARLSQAGPVESSSPSLGEGLNNAESPKEPHNDPLLEQGWGCHSY